MKKLRILLVEGFDLVRDGIRALLGAVEDFEIVGEGRAAEDIVALARELRPDVILIDQDLAGNNLLAVRAIKETVPHVEIIATAYRLNNTRALQAIEAGATGYVLKDIPVASLINAIRSVCNGRAFLHPEIARQLADRFVEVSRELHLHGRLESNGLTGRELEVLIELARGMTDREIASKFVVSEGTVKTHVHHILNKLGARNRTEAVAHVLRNGLIN